MSLGTYRYWNDAEGRWQATPAWNGAEPDQFALRMKLAPTRFRRLMAYFLCNIEKGPA